MKYGCPAQSEDDINYLEKFSRVIADWQNCLMEEKFPENDNVEKVCQLEVKPSCSLTKDRNKNPVTCGDKKNRFVYSFGYFVSYPWACNDFAINIMDKSNFLKKSIAGKWMINGT